MAGAGNGLRRWCEVPVDGCDMLGVDRRLAGHAEGGGGGNLALETGLVLEVEKGHIEKIDAGRGGGMDEPGAGIEQRFPCRLDAKIGRHVEGPEHQADDARARAGNRVTGFKPLVGLDDDMEADGRMAAAEEFLEQMYFIG